MLAQNLASGQQLALSTKTSTKVKSTNLQFLDNQILSNTTSIFKGKNPIYTLELSQKFDFPPSTTKSDNIGHPTAKTGQIWPLDGFEGSFIFLQKLKKSN